jgi:hypothetical protein
MTGIATPLTWPVGVTWTAWHYVWRILPVWRTDESGTLEADCPPALSADVARDGLQLPEDGSGPLFHRAYSGEIARAGVTAEELMSRLAADPNVVSPTRLARFKKTNGNEGEMRVGDEFVVRMPGPWDGPIRVVETTPTSFRFGTLDGHLEAGQIEWRARDQGGYLHFGVESWSRAGDRLSAIMHDRLRMAKEVQLYMWTSIVERVAREVDGRLMNGVTVHTRRVAPEAFT